MDLDLSFVRSHFPALESGWALFDNAGGVVAPRQVIGRASAYLEQLQVQLGASYSLSAEATRRVEEGKQAAADLIGASVDEVVLGPSTTMNVHVLAQALAETWKPGDEVVVTNLDHEANVGAWRRLESRGIVVREWAMNPETASLEVEALDALLSDRTRLVCFTHCSNVVGEIVDAAQVTRRAHEAGARVCVDGVAFAPHRRVDVNTIGADFYLLSLYKVFGPHLGLLYVRRDAQSTLSSQNHFFLGNEGPGQLMPGNVNHELTASLVGTREYLIALDSHHFGQDGELSEKLDRTFGLFADYEARIAQPLLEFLASKKNVTLIGPPTTDVHRRTSIFSFVVDGMPSSDVVGRIDPTHVAIRWGHFYAYRAIRDLGLLDRDGVVRVSMIHYNDPHEVDRLIRALDAAI